MKNKLEDLRQMLAAMDNALVAFSGGVDSTLLLKIAHDTLGSRAAGVIAVSPTLPPHELQEARELAGQMGWEVIELESREMELAEFTANTPRRCYFCKGHRYQMLQQYAAAAGYSNLLDGSNADDLNDFRPGSQAAREQNVRSPLQEVDLKKAEIRTLARELNLPNWDKPSSACLASRIPYGVPLSPGLLAQVGRAEAALAGMGFKQLRVRHHGQVARLELLQEDFLLAVELRDAIVQALEDAGYDYVALDLKGFRSGSMNIGLANHG